MEATEKSTVYRPWRTIWSAPRETAARAGEELTLPQLLVIVLINAIVGTNTFAASILKSWAHSSTGEFFAILGAMLLVTVILVWIMPLIYAFTGRLFSVSAPLKAIRNGSILSILPFILFNFITFVTSALVKSSGQNFTAGAGQDYLVALTMKLAPIPTTIVLIALYAGMFSIAGRGFAGIFGYTAIKGVLHIVIATGLLGLVAGVSTFLFLVVTG